MANNEDAPAENIIIIRRRGGESEDGHHGGAWKIAYADFMTAMMALFLVMWLINASNTEMKTSVAAYFSPIKLTDSVSRTKGMQDVVDKANHKGQAKPGGEDTKAEPKSEAEKKKSSEKPKTQSGPNTSDTSKEDKLRLAPPADATSKREDSAARSASANESSWQFKDPFQSNTADQVSPKDGTGKGSAAGEGLGQTEPNRAARDRIQEVETEDKRLAVTAGRVLQNVQDAARKLGIIGGPAIDVKVEDEAIVLSLTDTNTFGMFGIGSAEPNADLIKLMQTIAPVVTANSERIVVRGHTDGRQYRNDRNSNWRLSMSRAEAALALLVRAGVDESRFERIEAYADRKLKVPTSPESAGNRRIEIVLRQVAR
jgi:chemotaxis protein MotB